MAKSERRNWRRTPIDPQQLEALRNLSVTELALVLGLPCSRDITYQSQRHAHSVCYRIMVSAKIYQIISTGSKWFSALQGVGGGGAIDLTMHLYGEPYQAALQRLRKAYATVGIPCEEPEEDPDLLDHRAWISRLQCAYRNPAPVTGSGRCQCCSGSAVPYGKFCSRCYGGVLHAEGLPIEPGKDDGAHKEFNAEANAWIYDGKMPEPHLVAAIILRAYVGSGG